MTSDNLPLLPFERPNILDLSPQYHGLLPDRPVTQARTPVGDIGWLICGYPEVKALLADDRLGRSHHDPDNAARYSGSMVQGGPLGDPATEEADYALMRRLLAPAFSARRMQKLHGEVQKLVEDLCDRMAAETSPVDIQKVITYALPVMVICRLLGVSADDRDQFRAWSDAATALYDEQHAAEGFAALAGYMDRLIQVKREQPADDLISDLVAATDGETVTDGYLSMLVAGLLFAGHETTVLRLDYGTLYMLARPEPRELIREDPSLVSGAVEEILRLGAPGRPPLLHYSRVDMEVAGESIKAGDLVLLALEAANQDPKVFPDPARFDVTRRPNPHLTFGHGRHFCLGASLARIEMEVLFSTLFERFPALRLAVSLEEMRKHENPATGGLNTLPVAW
jgi:cytochrome P450